ncbi:hypothetical protein LZ32DRAFT_275517 [Colletotrichum eremochloae]|nr:hypothetical protein LZ32DRAFT_275517 [Colletotrichum eremochloae]
MHKRIRVSWAPKAVGTAIGSFCAELGRAAFPLSDQAHTDTHGARPHLPVGRVRGRQPRTIRVLEIEPAYA